MQLYGIALQILPLPAMSNYDHVDHIIVMYIWSDR